MKDHLRNILQNYKEIAGYIGDFQSRLILTFFYFTLMVPFALLARLIIDPLHTRKLPVSSGWVKRQENEASLQESQRQF
jgi:hypothetical protein